MRYKTQILPNQRCDSLLTDIREKLVVLLDYLDGNCAPVVGKMDQSAVTSATTKLNVRLAPTE